MKKDTLAALEAEGTSPSVVTASAEAAPAAPDQGEDVAKLKQDAEIARQEARFQALARKVDVDEFQFRDVYAADRKAAARVAKEKWGITPEEVLAQLDAAQRARANPDAPSVAPTATDMDAWYAKKQEAEAAQRAKEAAFAELNLSPEEISVVEGEFQFLSNGRRLDASATRRLVLAAYSAAKSVDVASVESARRTVSSIVTAGQSAVEQAPTVDPVKSEIGQWKAARDASLAKNWYKKG